ncbi:MAG TPA: M20/M25/M40 family metallo-hydrolase, partial [Flavisolibacter sp.]|nr:M20/M25/M40 family metallo-hydrolase [Flavisolibacter sp.]
MKKVFLLFSIGVSCIACAQKMNSVINVKEVERVESTLASDDMRGRKAGTPDIERAAQFIAGEFKKTGLQPVSGDSYLQEFTMVRSRLKSVKGEVDDHELDPKNIIVVTQEEELKLDEKSGYELQYVKSGEDLRKRVNEIMSLKKNAVVIIDTSFGKMFGRLGGMRRPYFKGEKKESANIVFLLGAYQPKEYKFKAEQTIEESKFANVVGVLPGKSRKNEYVIFSGHYDHLGIGKAQAGDSIYNGANDDAAGTTAVILLAEHFKKLNNNERTLVFVAFTAEEIGGFGSQYFSKQYDPSQVMAMFNIEMIGTDSKWGKNSAYITGFEKTNMGEILQKNLKGTSFSFYPDPYTDQNLYYRSD